MNGNDKNKNENNNNNLANNGKASEENMKNIKA